MLSDTIFYAPDSGQIHTAVLMLHGYGSNGDDLIGLAPALSKALPDTIFYAPNAPDVLTADGYKWYDLDEMAAESIYEHFDYLEKLTQRAKAAVSGVVDFMRYIEYKHSIRQEDVILMGFSQGGLLALMMGLSSLPSVKGMIACSAIPLCLNKFFTPSDVLSHPPVLLTHGTADDVVPFVGMEMTKNTLSNVGCVVQMHSVKGMGHSIDLSCEQAIIDFIQSLNQS